jgi:hypothetical protein
MPSQELKTPMSIAEGRYEDLFNQAKPYFPKATAQGNMTISKLNKFSYLPYAMAMNVVFHQVNALMNSAK